jgi:hypothetical protein
LSIDNTSEDNSHYDNNQSNTDLYHYSSKLLLNNFTLFQVFVVNDESIIDNIMATALSTYNSNNNVSTNNINPSASNESKLTKKDSTLVPQPSFHSGHHHHSHSHSSSITSRGQHTSHSHAHSHSVPIPIIIPEHSTMTSVLNSPVSSKSNIMTTTSNVVPRTSSPTLALRRAQSMVHQSNTVILKRSIISQKENWKLALPISIGNTPFSITVKSCVHDKIECVTDVDDTTSNSLRCSQVESLIGRFALSWVDGKICICHIICVTTHKSLKSSTLADLLKPSTDQKLEWMPVKYFNTTYPIYALDFIVLQKSNDISSSDENGSNNSLYELSDNAIKIESDNTITNNMTYDTVFLVTSSFSGDSLFIPMDNIKDTSMSNSTDCNGEFVYSLSKKNKSLSGDCSIYCYNASPENSILKSFCTGKLVSQTLP